MDFSLLFFTQKFRNIFGPEVIENQTRMKNKGKFSGKTRKLHFSIFIFQKVLKKNYENLGRIWGWRVGGNFPEKSKIEIVSLKICHVHNRKH